VSDTLNHLKQLTFIIEGTALNLSQTWAMDKQIRGPQQPYDAALTLDNKDGGWADLGEAIPLE